MKTFSSNISPSAVGIDVAKATLSVCIRTTDGNEYALTIRNTDADIRTELLPRLAGYTGKVVMESTGHYHWMPALLLRDGGADVRVVNPLLSKQYTTGNIRKVKTDPADASGLARMAALSDQLPPSFSVSRETLALRKTLATIGSMSHQVQALTASMKSVREAHAILGTEDSDDIRALEESIATLKRSLKTLESSCVAEVNTDPRMKAKRGLLSSIPGVSDFCATLAINWFSENENATDKSWVAFAGLDVSSRESGTWKGRCKLTKRGNSFLRRRLYSAAWGAVMNNESFHQYYDHLRKDEGRAHVEALTIIARKIVRTMFSVVKSNTTYNQSLFRHKYMLSTPLPLASSL